MPNVTINIPPVAVVDVVAAFRALFADAETPLPAGESSALEEGIRRIVQQNLQAALRAHQAQVAQQALAQANENTQAALENITIP